MTHAQRVGAECYKAAKKLHGAGWRLLATGQKYNAVCRQVVAVLMAQGTQHPETLTYLQDVARAAALLIEEE